ncbi:MAG TPA: hypothetical protein PKA80_12915, partial [Ignavibacteriaceae bacterium]|nr:hypothetical protein [Ignavibacteriaceae bacterium]
MKPKIFLLSCLSFIIFNFSFIIGTVRYVSPTGSSTPPYTTWETAADSIMECINISVFGDTIYVANGTYKEQVVMIPGLSLIGAGMDSCVIDTRELTLTSEFFTVHGFDNSYLSNFKIFTYDVQNGSGILIDGGLNSVYKFCEINEAYFGFAIFSSAQNNPLVYQNMIKTVSDGIICFGSPLISENIIYAHGNGLVSQINSSPTYINNIIHCADCYLGFYDALGFISKLESNIFYRTGTESGDGAFQSYGNDSIINNVVYGIEVGWDHGLFGVGTIAANNHFQNVNTVLVYDQIAGSPQTFQYNNLWDYETASLNISIDSTNMYSDPMFANPDSLDFHLQKYSPLIDAGDPTILDKDGTRSDIGLYGGPYGEQYHYIDLAPRTPINLT